MTEKHTPGVPPHATSGMADTSTSAHPRPARRAADESEGPIELTPEQLQMLREALEARRASLIEAIEEKRHAEQQTVREVGDEMDDASTEGAAAMTSKLLERDVQLLGEIQRALAKFADGTYGICEGTGEPIGFDRLRLRPWARFSVEYQEQLEQEARRHGVG